MVINLSKIEHICIKEQLYGKTLISFEHNGVKINILFYRKKTEVQNISYCLSVGIAGEQREDTKT
jgi:hypothetical protein